jgi:hypothetical protein
MFELQTTRPKLETFIGKHCMMAREKRKKEKKKELFVQCRNFWLQSSTSGAYTPPSKIESRFRTEKFSYCYRCDWQNLIYLALTITR